MALVKMVRDFPEVAGGNTTAMIPEEAVNLAMDNGWRVESKGASTPKTEVKAPVEEVKTETKAEEVKVEKTETPKAKKRDA